MKTILNNDVCDFCERRRIHSLPKDRLISAGPYITHTSCLVKAVEEGRR